MNRSCLTWCASLALTPFLGIAACNDSAVDPRRVLTTVNVSVGAVTLEVGEMTGVTASGVVGERAITVVRADVAQVPSR